MIRELNILPYYAIGKKLIIVMLSILFIMPIIWGSIKNHYESRDLKDFIKSLGTLPNNLVLENIIYYARDNNNNLISIKAPKARAEDEKTQKLFLANPMVKVTDQDGNLLSVNSDNGEFSRLDKYIIFSDNVMINDDKNHLQTKTDKVMFNSENGIITIPNKLNASQNNNILSAGKTEISSKDKTITFSDGVHIRIGSDKK